eukprot:CFRG7086T1
MLANAARRMSAMGSKAFKLALIQMPTCDDVPTNLTTASNLVKEAASNGAEVIALPECFNSPYGAKFFPQYAESRTGMSATALSQMAKDNNVFLVGGSIPERFEDKFYNTCLVYNREGERIATHRKLHLFDIDVPGGIRFKESETLTEGNSFTTFQTDKCMIGIGICYDIRFPELAHIYADKGCDLIVYPGAFNMTTGPPHWELLQRARAVDNQVYIAAVCGSRDENGPYVAWGHSTVVDPWGTVLSTTEHETTIVYATIDPDRIKEVRAGVPVTQQRRLDIYTRTKPL